MFGGRTRSERYRNALVAIALLGTVAGCVFLRRQDEQLASTIKALTADRSKADAARAQDSIAAAAQLKSKSEEARRSAAQVKEGEQGAKKASAQAAALKLQVAGLKSKVDAFKASAESRASGGEATQNPAMAAMQGAWKDTVRPSHQPPRILITLGSHLCWDFVGSGFISLRGLYAQRTLGFS